MRTIRQLAGGKTYHVIDIDYKAFTKTPDEKKKLKQAKLNKKK